MIKYTLLTNVDLDVIEHKQEKTSKNLLLPKDKYVIRTKNGEVNLLKDNISNDEKFHLIDYIERDYNFKVGALTAVAAVTTMSTAIGYFPGIALLGYSIFMGWKHKKICKNYEKNHPYCNILNLTREDRRIRFFVGSIIDSIVRIKGKDYKFTDTDIIAYAYNRILHAGLAN